MLPQILPVKLYCKGLLPDKVPVICSILVISCASLLPKEGDRFTSLSGFLAAA